MREPVSRAGFTFETVLEGGAHDEQKRQIFQGGSYHQHFTPPTPTEQDDPKVDGAHVTYVRSPFTRIVRCIRLKLENLISCQNRFAFVGPLLSVYSQRSEGASGLSGFNSPDSASANPMVGSTELFQHQIKLAADIERNVHSEMTEMRGRVSGVVRA